MVQEMEEIFLELNDQKIFQDCVTKILDMDETDLVNLIKNILAKKPETMKIVKEY